MSSMMYHLLFSMLVCVVTGAAKMLLVETMDTKNRHFSPQYIGGGIKNDLQPVDEAGDDYMDYIDYG